MAVNKFNARVAKINPEDKKKRYDLSSRFL